MGYTVVIMGKKEKVGYNRIEIESDSNGEWKESKGQDYEYWSKNAMEQRGLKDRYPQETGESDEEYETRLQLIGKHALNESEMPAPEENTPYYYSESGERESDNTGGYVFQQRPRTPKEINERNLKTFYTQEILGSAEDARGSGKILGIKGLREKLHISNSNESKTLVAEYYVGSLDGSDNNTKLGVLQNIERDEKRYSDRNRHYVRKRRQEIANNYALSGEEKIERIADKKLEGFFYPLVEQGFFDTDAGSAGYFLTSEYDDYCHGIDTAIVVPIQSVNDNGKKETLNQVIGFDLTAGSGKNKLKHIKEHHGLSSIEFPSTIQKKELPSMDTVPQFTICLPRGKESNELFDGLMKGGLPSNEIQLLINYQIWRQATYFTTYWRDQPGHLEDAKTFARIANLFNEKVKSNLAKSKDNLEDVLTRRHATVNYLSLLK